MGSMMANAGRDPIFWATLAIAEQDFDGAGDLCIRCHSTGGWIAGRSTPTDGSGLTAGDSNGVECDFCHKMTNPDDSEHVGEQFSPFIANDGGSPATGYYGSGMASLWGGSEKLGPFSDPAARHQFIQSQFHRSVDFCGTCHDVSNPAVGDLAHNNGTQDTADPVVSSGVLGSPVQDKAAFNNFPYQYGIVERTFSEYKSGLLSETLVSDYLTLPSDLQAGAVMDAYQNALTAGTGGNYEDGTLRYFSCQTCHLRPVEGLGCDKNGVPLRKDLPLHDMTGGNYWMPDAIQYLDTQGKLRLGGGLTAGQIAAMNDGINRAKQQLNLAVALEVNNNTIRVINLTGHKVISGYPEGRRMWLNIKWYDTDNILLREDGAYGPITADIDGVPTPVNTILDLEDPNTKIYEAHYGMTQQWATQLLALGKPAGYALSYDRVTGLADYTLGNLAGEAPGTYHETFHFVLNNKVVKDNRIPPYGMRYDMARVRNALPVPADQYGNPGPGGTYNYWDEVSLNPPAGAESAAIDMLYQPTSWEYIQFLYLANDRANAFLANEGEYMLEAWLNAGMADPYIMASAIWTVPPSADTGGPYAGVEGQTVNLDASGSIGSIVLYEWDIDSNGTYDYSSSSPSESHTYPQQGVFTIRLRVTDNLGRSDEATTTANISDTSPTADFTGAPTSGNASLAVDFTNSSTGYDTPLSYEWDFDNNGSTDSTSQNPSYSYTLPGIYSVKLTVTDSDLSTGTLVRTDYITVTSPSYTLTVNITGSGTVTSLPAGIDCLPDCDEPYTAGTVVALTPAPSEDFVFTGWSGDADCSDGSVTMDTSKTCTATFESCSSRLVMVDGDVTSYHTSIQTAYTVSSDSDTIRSQAVTFTEDLQANIAKSVTLMGGYNCEYSSVTGLTIINGALTVTEGKLAIGTVTVN
jgi:PKD repeat protein